MEKMGIIPRTSLVLWIVIVTMKDLSTLTRKGQDSSHLLCRSLLKSSVEFCEDPDLAAMQL